MEKPKNDIDFTFIELAGFVAPYDVLRVSKHNYGSTGGVKRGMLVDIRSGKGWVGGVMSKKDAIALRDAITEWLNWIA